jgi:hypothetical protein
LRGSRSGFLTLNRFFWKDVHTLSEILEETFLYFYLPIKILRGQKSIER